MVSYVKEPHFQLDRVEAARVEDPAVARLSRAEAKVRTRERLVESAIRVFAEHGYYGATVEEISEAAGFSTGAFYANFADKSDCLAIILDDYWTDQMALLDRLVRARDHDKRAVVQAWFDRLMTERSLELATTELWSSATLDTGLRQRLGRHQVRMRSAVGAMIEEYCEESAIELPLPTEHFAAIILAVGAGLARQRRLEPESLPPGLLNEALRVLWRGVLPGRVGEAKLPERASR